MLPDGFRYRRYLTEAKRLLTESKQFVVLLRGGRDLLDLKNSGTEVVH